MAVEVGELVVGAYLKEVLGCDFVDYSVRAPGGGRVGQHEFDVLGLDFDSDTAFLCEVATHLDGLNYGGKKNQDTLDRVIQKHERQQEYAQACLGNFEHHRFMFWSPRVPVGFLTEGLARLESLEVVANADYAAAVDELCERASASTKTTSNDFFRALQILEHLRR